MFELQGLNTLYLAHKDSLSKLAKIGDALSARYYRMQDPVDALLLAAMSGEALVFIGPPGTAKSRLVRSFCNLIGLLDDGVITSAAQKAERSEDYFEYLLTQFTEPSELFGFFDISKLNTQSELVRIEDRMMQKAKVVFLDEVFNASSAILNSLLTFMNERMFHDRGKIKATPLELLISATNNRPTDPLLAAVYDRFLLRCQIDSVASQAMQADELRDLLTLGWSETHTTRVERDPSWSTMLVELRDLRSDVARMSANNSLSIDPVSPLFSGLADIVRTAVKTETSEMSNRRLVKLTGVVLHNCLLRGARENLNSVQILPQDMDVVLRFALDRNDVSAVAKMRAHLEAL